MTYPTNVTYRGESPDRSIRVRRLRLNAQGYTPDKGTYYGVGAPLYEAWDAEEGLFYEVTRAYSRQVAIDALQIPAAKLYRR